MFFRRSYHGNRIWRCIDQCNQQHMILFKIKTQLTFITPYSTILVKRSFFISLKRMVIFKELERSSSRETLSSPVGNSPVCCQPCSPPCSPPPAPAAYISSARASSRRLTTGSGLGGLPSPERDPFGRLLSYL
ncbi:hypothetical protein HZH68_011612 [Vespula germanica]|uniref:Uncharacterized protein n=1 Tax=Vespula germanica TaxID=30212 RepID=A0A834JSB8_VESGE|nr:hypothetical protein HZH68_011612 [Vespula germanica]